MTTNFTLRDFFAFLLTGLTFIASISILFYNEILDKLVFVYSQYPFINDISFFLAILFIPITYLLGHFFGVLSYLYRKLYLNCRKLNGIKKYIPKLIKFPIIYSYKLYISCAIEKKTQKDQIAKNYFKNRNEFWTKYSLLKIENNYSQAEYWYLLNEFFNNTTFVFLLSAIIAFFVGHWFFGIIYISITIGTFIRASQYADLFVTSVVRLLKVRELKNEEE